VPFMIEPGVSVPKLLSASSCSIKDDIIVLTFFICENRVFPQGWLFLFPSRPDTAPDLQRKEAGILDYS
ncbi:MAG: hypothetical protein IJX22_05055, partial [Opitutales bacterium]|nr:hypothetical protein [Opitutales bacterium]